MDELVRICGIALVAILCLSLFRDKAPSMGLVLALGVTAVLAAVLIPMVGRVLDCVRSLVDAAGLDYAAFAPVMQVVGICLAVKISAELCRDAGERTLASIVEIGGAAAGVLCAVPLVEQALQLIRAI